MLLRLFPIGMNCALYLRWLCSSSFFCNGAKEGDFPQINGDKIVAFAFFV
jgi:hypothetical protein